MRTSLNNAHDISHQYGISKIILYDVRWIGRIGGREKWTPLRPMSAYKDDDKVMLKPSNIGLYVGH